MTDDQRCTDHYSEPVSDCVGPELRDRLAAVEAERHRDTCSECGGTPQSCAGSRIKCCPECNGYRHQALANRDRWKAAEASLAAVLALCEDHDPELTFPEFQAQVRAAATGEGDRG